MHADLFSAGGKMFGRRDEPYAIYQQASPLVTQRHFCFPRSETDLRGIPLKPLCRALAGSGIYFKKEANKQNNDRTFNLFRFF